MVPKVSGLEGSHCITGICTQVNTYTNRTTKNTFKYSKSTGHNVSTYLRESVNLVGVVKSTCTLYAAQLEYQAIAIKIDYAYTAKYPDPNVVTVAPLMVSQQLPHSSSTMPKYQ